MYDCEWVCVCIFGQGNYYSHGQAQNICYVSKVLPKWKIMTIFIIETLEMLEKVVLICKETEILFMLINRIF